MTNIRNHGVAIGRLSKDVTVFKNKDGSCKVMLTLAVQDNFTSKDGKKNSQFISLEGFIRADKAKDNNGVYDHMHKGDMIGVEYSVRTNNYEKNGETVYGQVLFIEAVDLMESKRTTDARQAKNAVAQSGAQAPAPAADAAAASEDVPFN